MPTPSTTTAVRNYVDSVRIAFRHRRDERRLKQYAKVHRVRDREETWTWERGENRDRRKVVTRRRPPVVVRGTKYRPAVDVHQPSSAAWSIVRSAVAHARAVCLRLDVATDLIFPTREIAERVHAAVLRGLVVVGARGGVRRHASGTTYIGAERRVTFETTHEPARRVRRRRTDQREGVVFVAYANHHAAKKNDGRPTFHGELRAHGSRVVRTAFGVALAIERAWRRVRMVEDVGAALNGIPPLVRRAAQNAEGSEPYAADVYHVIRGRGFASERRKMIRRATPFDRWTASVARRRFATESENASTHREAPVPRGSRARSRPSVPTRVHAPTAFGIRPAVRRRTDQPASPSVQPHEESHR